MPHKLVVVATWVKSQLQGFTYRGEGVNLRKVPTGYTACSDRSLFPLPLNSEYTIRNIFLVVTTISYMITLWVYNFDFVHFTTIHLKNTCDAPSQSCGSCDVGRRWLWCSHTLVWQMYVAWIILLSAHTTSQYVRGIVSANCIALSGDSTLMWHVHSENYI